jgi:mRNA interferase YafQ
VLKLVRSNKFKREFALAERRRKDIDKLIEVMTLLANEHPLPHQYRNHPLHGNWKGKMECHIEDDWLLIYEIDPVAGEVTFHRTGTHSDLF